MDEPLLWYVAYGSNLSAARLGHYLAGGVPPGARRRCPGCRDPRPPRRAEPVLLPGGVYFALESTVWTGGVALYDPSAPGWAPARAYLLSGGQFADLLAQEMHRPPGADLPLRELAPGGRITFGPGHYETLVCAGDRDGHPMLTFTAPWRAGEVPLNPPAPAYLAMVAGGLHEAHGWGAARITDYLLDRPGIAGRLTRAAVAATVRGALGGARPPGQQAGPVRP